MNNISIDLSMRSSGICANLKDNIIFKLIQNPNLNDEELLIENSKQIIEFIKEYNFDEIRIEGLSFNSVSGDKDIIAGNFWNLRCKLREEFPNTIVRVVPVTSWRSPLFNKEERKLMKDSQKQVKELKLVLKGIKGNERKEKLIGYEDVIKNSSIKYQTYMKLPDNVKELINNITVKDSRYDLADAYFLSVFTG